MILAFDTETTGKIDTKKPHTAIGQPRICQLGMALVEMPSLKLHSYANILIKPDGWGIPDEAAAIHGITTELALKYGVSILSALRTLNSMAQVCGLDGGRLVAHNMKFDITMVNIECSRMVDQSVFLAPLFELEQFCTMENSTNVCKIPGKYGSYKWPSLAEAYKFFTGKEIIGAHDALTDATASAVIYGALTAPRPGETTSDV